jgi:hypothetical protein
MNGTAEVVWTLPSTARPARWLVVVRRDQLRLYGHLRQEFDGISLVEVVLDRRRDLEDGAARVHTPVDRRRPVPSKERARWRSFGFQIVRRREEPVLQSA